MKNLRFQNGQVNLEKLNEEKNYAVSVLDVKI